MLGSLRRLVLAGLVVVLSGCAAAEAPQEVSPSSSAPSPAPASSAPPTPTAVRTTVTDPKLRKELLAMLAADQKSRADPDGGNVNQDQARTDRLKEIIAAYGWPTRTMVGKDGATAAWAIAQHSDLDPAFQRQALDLLRQAAAAGEASKGDLAYLTDRVAAGANEPQTYGTQGGCTPDGKFELRPLVEPDRVDELRAEAGLPPLAEYEAEMVKICAEES